MHTCPADVRHRPLHFVDHFKAKRPERREAAATTLANMPTARVVYVITHKDSLARTAELRRDKSVFYNYVTRLTLERVADAAHSWPGGPRWARVFLGEVKPQNHRETLDYLNDVRSVDRSVPWERIKWPPTWSNTERDGVQLADLYAGFLHVALSGKPDDLDCATGLLTLRHQLRRDHGGHTLGHGVKILGDELVLLPRPW